MSGRIEISYDDGSLHNSVKVAGEFTNWEGVPLGLDSGTKYAAVFDGAEPGSTYMYKYIIDGEWRLLSGHHVVSDSAGNTNHSIAVPKLASTQTDSEPYELVTTQLSHPGHEVGITGTAAALGTNGITAESTRDFDSGAAIPGSRPYEYNDEPKLNEADRDAYDYQRGQLTEPIGGLTGGANRDTYEYTESQLSHPKEKVATLDELNPGARIAAAQLGGQNLGSYGLNEGQLSHSSYTANKVAGIADNNKSLGHEANFDPYELKPGQIPHATEKVAGLDQVKVEPSEILDPYELKESQLAQPVEEVSGLNHINTVPSQSREPYEFKESQLSNPIEKVVSLDESGPSDLAQKTPSKPSPYELQESQLPHPTDKITGLDKIAGLDKLDAIQPKANLDLYGLKENQLSHPTEVVREPSKGDSQLGSYDYKESQLVQPKDIVDPNATIDASVSEDESAFQDAYDAPSSIPSTSAIPGQLPFEKKIVGDVNPGQVEKSTLHALGGTSAGSESLPSAQPNSRQSLEYSDALDAPEDHRKPALISNAPTTGLESDNALNKKYSGTGQRSDSELDFDAAQRAVRDTHADQDAASYGYAPAITAASATGNRQATKSQPQQQPHHHQPIDVTTGFPIDDGHELPNAATASSPSSRQHRHTMGGVPTLRTETRSSRGSGTQPLGSGSSTDHRNAAVIAAASKASAFAKQDVANISKPPEETATSPRKTRPISAQFSSPHSSGTQSSTGHHRQNLSSTSAGAASSAPSSVPTSAGTIESAENVPPLPLQQKEPALERTTLERTGTKREGRLRRFFSKLGSK